MPSSKESSQLRDATHVPYVSCLGRQVLYTGATWETKKKKKRKKSIKLITYYIVHATLLGTSLVAQMVKNEPAMQETQVRSLSQKDPLKKGMATHSNIFAWRIPWPEEPCRLQSMGSRRVGHN